MTTETTLKADLCIVGAGIAGLNAAFVASQYLGKTGKIILLDRRPRVGGMWVSTYDYVRLHQPHPYFTAGNIKWTSGKDRSHLASKPEVLEHLKHCAEVIATRVGLDERYGWEYESHDERDGRVFTRFSRGDERLVVDSRRLIKCFGGLIEVMTPLAVSSSRVRSVSPDSCDVRAGEIAADTNPVWVIGGGKTGMDTARALIRQYPGREVNLLAGSGTFFARRDEMFPISKRWRSGAVSSLMFAEMARQYDGTNEPHVLQWMRDNHGVALSDPNGAFLFGLLADDERNEIARGLNTHIKDHFVDVTDESTGPTMQLRSGDSLALTPGTWVVNCTGYFHPKDVPYEPFVSPSGAVLSIQGRSWFLNFTSWGAYFATHLMFRDKLHTAPLYELDILDLMAKSKAAWTCAFMALALHNFSVIYDELPPKVFMQNGLDFDRWYPFPRRMLATMRFMRSHRRDREHHRRTLDTVHDRYDVRCGLLVDK